MQGATGLFCSIAFKLIVERVSYDAASALHRLQVTGFAKEPTGSYARFDELHEQRAYEAIDVDGWVEAAGLASQRIDFDEGGPPSSSTGRLFYACRPR